MTAPSETPIPPTDVLAGLAVAGLRAGAGVVRILAVPARAAADAPVIGPPLRRRVERLGAEGHAALVRGRAQAETVVARVLAAPEVERTMDHALEGPLTEALARSLAHHRVGERLAGELVAAGAIEHAVVAALEHEEAERLLRSPEMTAILEYIATSPEVRRVFQEQSTSLAGEMVDDVRSRSERLDSAAETTVRGWLRRPRPNLG